MSTVSTKEDENSRGVSSRMSGRMPDIYSNLKGVFLKEKL